MKRTAPAALILAVALSACGELPAPPTPAAAASEAAAAPEEAIRDTSFADDQGVRTIQLSVIIPAPQADVFNAVATTDGWKTWAVPTAFGIIAAGNVIETSYDLKANPGDKGNITQEFQVVLPPRMIVMRTVKAPDGFPNAELYYKTTSVMELAGEDEKRTRLTLTHTGFSPGEGFDQLHEFFKSGDAEALKQLKKRFESGPVDWAKQQ